MLFSGWIQFLSVFGGDKYMNYIEAGKQIFFYHRHKNVVHNVEFEEKFVSDMTCDLWKGQFKTMFSYYDPKAGAYFAVLPDRSRIRFVSPIVRCLWHNTDDLSGSILGMGGEMVRFNQTHRLQTTFPFHIRTAEYYHPYIYIIDEYDSIYTYDPFRNEMLRQVEMNFTTPVHHFHITSDGRSCFALHNKTLLLSPDVITQLPYQPIRVSCDEHRCIVALENGSIYVVERKSGNILETYQDCFHPAYLTRMYLDRNVVYMDGQKERPRMLKINKYKETSSREIDDFTSWISPPSAKTFMNALMKTPPYNYKPPQPMDDNSTSI